MAEVKIDGMSLAEYNARSFRMAAEGIRDKGKAALMKAEKSDDDDGKKKKRKVKKPLDANRKKVLQIIEKMRAEGETFDKIAIFLDAENLPTFSNRGQWHAQTVHRLYQDHILP